MSARVAVVTGGSSGIGRCTAELLCKKGLRVYELSRRGSDFSGVTHLTADVTDEGSVKAAIDEIIGREGRIDILISNAGFGISGAVEFTRLSEAQRQIDVNFFGAVRVVSAVLPHMREKKCGRIVLISSVAAIIPIPFQTYYSVSKAAINSYAQALRLEVAPFGISVCAVMPGDISSNFTAARDKLHDGDDIYGGRISRSVAGMEKDEQTGMAPDKAAGLIVRVALREAVSPLCVIGFQYKLFALLTKILPVSLINRLVGILYAG